MGKKYLETKGNSLESSILGLWQEAAKKEEELTPKQKKIDVDGDGEIEASDLAKLRKKGAKKEGNSFGMALKAAKDKGEKTFVVSGKTYEVKEESDLDEGKMSQLHQYIKDKKSPEEIAKMMKLDVKTVKALMAGYMSSSYHESYEIGTDEYREHTQEITPGQEITDFQRFKVESMKEALAKVWGLDEAKKEEKKENKDLTKASKSGKVITGSDADEIDLKPKTAE
jgi:hypothetical protein|tara:strand:+ start:767 stop:1444 length:678 start_codon:yes stop_codon:yes gene_type:complete